jgi:catechol 2,3-dioxygenase-like lactoylglutathione lyase family enzyme
MKHIGTLIAVRDMERSKRFYKELFGLEVEADYGANVVLTGGKLFLQTLDTWTGFILRPESEIDLYNNATEIYFEESDMDCFLATLNAYPDIEYIHPLIEHNWGQRAVRFRDPDGHIIEVGEDMRMVVRRFLGSGMTAGEVALRMDVPEGYVLSMMDDEEKGL